MLSKRMSLKPFTFSFVLFNPSTEVDGNKKIKAKIDIAVGFSQRKIKLQKYFGLQPHCLYLC
ncbi:MAG: hypothetical protein K9H48_08505 [Melioribacteraceae bacterium]|nr:hypothetical protein [Melioribacteraceae bacterium]MCF8394090.1 hypothetical protein [Melioribacteraceae bacterium]